MAVTAYTTYDVSVILEEEPRLLTFLEKIRNRLYTEYYIKKRSGGKREINTYLYKAKNKEEEYPSIEFNKIYNLEKLTDASLKLKEIHTKINNRIFKELKFPESVHGFIPGKSILSAAKPHVGKRWVISMDIHDFFGSVRSNYVLESLVNNFGFGREAAWLIARLVAHKRRLPQGAVTSPMASNVAFYSADKEIEAFCQEHNITYTRYADDLIFSFNDDSLKDKILNKIPEITEKHGYKINHKKTKVYGPTQIHYVLGYVVNRKLNVNKETRRRLEAAIYNFVHKHQVPYPVKNYVRYKRSLIGKATHILNANPDLTRLRRFLRELKEFDPNKHEFEYIYI